MNARTLLTIAIAAVVLIGGAAAVGAASPADAANETATDANDALDEERNSTTPGANASDLQGNNAESVGPGDGLPSQAADHVSDVHDRINGFLNGSIDHLGESLSDLLSNDDAGEETADEDDEVEDES